MSEEDTSHDVRYKTLEEPSQAHSDDGQYLRHN